MALTSPPYVLQAGTVSHGAQLFRNALGTLISPAGGIISGGDLAVSQNGSPNMSVNVAAGQVWIPGSQAGTFPSGAQIQGPYYTEQTALQNLTIAAANATNPRLDQIVAQVQDAAYAGAANSCQLAVITGTPTAGASLTNLVGLGTFPPASSSALLLAYVLVPANATSIVTADISNVASAGGWTALTLATNINSAGLYVPSVRVAGDVVRFKGALANATGATIATGTQIATLPSGTFPTATGSWTLDPIVQDITAGTSMAIRPDENGHLNIVGSWATGHTIGLDGVTYTLT